MGVLAGNAGGSVLFNDSNPGGVLLDHTATLIGTELSELRGATFDPRTNQLVFLGEELDPASGTGVEGLDMDYFFTAVQAVYGSAVPPYVTIEPPAVAITAMTDGGGDGDGVLEPGETASMVLRHRPLWADEGGEVKLRFVIKETGSNKIYDFHTDLEIQPTGVGHTGQPNQEALVYQGQGSWDTGSRHHDPSQPPLPDSVGLVDTPFQLGGGSHYYDSGRRQWTSHYPVTLYNDGTESYEIQSAQVVPSRQHRRFGGRVDGTRAGWVMYEADRIMKCLAVGLDPLTGATYDSLTVPVTGFKNMLERDFDTPSEAYGDIRMWFMPAEVNLKRHLDEATGRSSMLFDSTKVELLTEAALAGTVASPNAYDFAQHFTDNYADFAGIEFTVVDPDDPSGQTTIDVKIFDMLEDVMEAVSLARFLRDNGVPLDMWWLNSWEPPRAHSPRSVATAYNEMEDGGSWFYVQGGVDIPTPNAYVPDPTASNVAVSVLAAQPPRAENPESDLDEQSWDATAPEVGDVTAVAATSDPEAQDGTIVLGETDLAAPSVGELPLAHSRFYQSSWLGKGDLGPGWRTARFQLEFARPSWYDEHGLMEDTHGDRLPVNSRYDTGFRSGIVRVVDLGSGGGIEFSSSLDLRYRVDALNNPEILVSGLKADGSPDFLPVRDIGNLVQLVQDPVSKQYTFTTNEGHLVEFDSEGRVLRTVDKYGNEQIHVYDAETGRVARIEDGEGQKIEFAYDADGRMESATLTKINLPHAAVTETVNYTYYGAGPHQGCLETVTAVRGGNSVKYLYNERCQLVSKEYFDEQNAPVATVDLKGRAEETEDGRGNTINSTFTRDETTDERITITSDPLIDPASGFLPTERRYDDLDRLVSTSSVTGLETTYGYDPGSLFPNLIQPPIEGRDAIEIERDELGRPERITDPTNVGALPVEMVYNADGLLEDTFDEIGRKTEVRYTAHREVDHVTRYFDGAPVRIGYGYDAATGYLETVTNPENETVTMERDSKGRVTAVEDATGVRIEYEYDAYGRLWKTYDPRMVDPIVYTYDDSDRIAQVTAPNGITSYEYDPETGALVSTTDPLGRRTRYEYYDNGDVRRVFLERDLPDGTVETLDTTEFGYDRFGNLTMVHPGGAAPIFFETDEIGRGTGSYEVDNRRPGPPRFLESDKAENGMWTKETDHTFVWGAPESDSGIEGYSWSLDTEPDETVDVPGGTVTLPDVDDGRRVFRVKAKTNESTAGESTVSFWGEEATFDLWVDATDPEVVSLSAAPGSDPSTSRTVSLVVQDAHSGIDISHGIALRHWITDPAQQPAGPPRGQQALSSGDGSNWTGSLSLDWSSHAGKRLWLEITVRDIAGNEASATHSHLIEGGKAPFLFFTK